MEPAVTKLLETAGLLGPILVLFGWYILSKDREIRELRIQLSEAQEARTKDAKAVVTELMELNDKWVAALNGNTSVLQETRTMLTIFRHGPAHGPGHT